MAAFNIWADEAPPASTWVWARVTLTRDRWRLVATCPSGCCAMDPTYNCIHTPTYWKPATNEEIASLGQVRH